ncbi:MAG: Chemotaxis protein CheY [Planctomycetota bacterium]|jgi:two-component system chemotaxis response regulator CheY
MPRLLIVDDALVMRKIIGSIATESGWTIVAEGENGLRGVELYRELKPDLVTMDLVMPVMGGLDALKEIRKADDTAKIVVITAVDQKQTLVDAIESGAIDFIVKPFQREHVKAVLIKVAQSLNQESDA